MALKATGLGLVKHRLVSLHDLWVVLVHVWIRWESERIDKGCQAVQAV